MQPYKVIIVDDEPLAREVLEAHFNSLEQFEIVGLCENALQANEILQSEDVDLMCLDIQMPKITGLDFLKSLTNPPEVIMTTAYADYAVEGFNLNVLDYLMKPISLERLLQATNKFIDKVSVVKQAGEEDNFFFVKADKKMMKIHFNDILFIEGLKDYVIIKKDTSRVITLQTMKSLEAKLPQDIFMRIHRSYIVNVNKINAVFGSMVEISENGKPKNLPVGKNYKEELMKLIESNKL